MKIFAIVLAVAFILGGLVGGEILDSGFSITGAVVAGLGTFAVLMGLGAFFTAREEKRPKSSLPPEIRGVFDRMTQNAGLLKQAAKSVPKSMPKNTPKPFFQNNSRAERIEWFKTAPKWNELNIGIVEKLCDKFGENPLFEVFVLLSQQQGLIPKYVRLNNKAATNDGLKSVCQEISGILTEFAQAKSTEFYAALKSKEKTAMENAYGAACDAAETAIVLEPLNIQPYCQITTLKSTTGNYEEARDFGMRGMLQIERMKQYPLEKSKSPSVSGSLPVLEIFANMLADLVAEAVIEINKKSA